MTVRKCLLNLSSRRIRFIYGSKRSVTSLRDDIDFSCTGLTKIEKSHFKGPITKFPKCDNITDFIFMNKANVKNRTALTTSRNGENYSYQQTYTHVCNLAAFIEKEYISKYKPENKSDKFVISVALSNSIKTAVVYLGVPKINNAILNPVNPLLTEYEFSNVFSVVNPNLIICEPGNIDYIKNSIMNYKLPQPENIICLDSDLWYEFTRNNCETMPDLNYVKINEKINDSPAIYGMSSGTTGLSKGVVLSHNNIISNIHQIRITSEMAIDNKELTLLHSLPLHHAYGFGVMLYNEIMSASNIVIQPNFEPRTFLKDIERYKINKIYLVPTMLNFMATHNMTFNYSLKSVRDLLCAAAPLSPAIIDAFTKRFPRIFLRQTYGLTETLLLTMIKKRNNKIISVGQPMPGIEIKIVNPKNNELNDIEQEGELLTRGQNVMNGYLNMPEENIKILNQDEWFHTGDIAKTDQDGYVYIMDRVKDMIKVNGVQVSPVEIEKLLISHPSVADVLVFGISDEKRGEIVVVYVVPEENIHFDKENFQTFMEENLTKEKHPFGGIFIVKNIKRSASGKVLRKLMKDEHIKNLNTTIFH